jgi:transketolase
MTLLTGDEKHSLSATSTLDVVWALYDSVLNVALENPQEPDRDRILHSKGHGPMAYYAVLLAKGFLDVEEFESWGECRIFNANVRSLPIASVCYRV